MPWSGTSRQSHSAVGPWSTPPGSQGSLRVWTQVEAGRSGVVTGDDGYEATMRPRLSQREPRLAGPGLGRFGADGAGRGGNGGAVGDGAGAAPGLEIRRGGLGSPAQAVALATLCVVLFLTFLDNTIVSVGLASVQSTLHAGVTSLQWVVNGYALTFAAFMLAAGTLGDILGRKKIMLAGIAVFCAGSVIAALASNVDMLIAGRVVMGLGAAASEPGTLSIIRHVYPDRRTRADALGVWAAIAGLALALGPVIGGAMVGLNSWRDIFWFNLFVGVVAFGMAVAFVPETADPGDRRIDVPGIVLAAVALAAGSFAVIQGEESGYGEWWIILLFALAGFAAIVFVTVERRVRSPMLELSLFAKAPVAGSNFVAFAAYFGIFSIFFFTALYLQVVTNASAYQTAIDFLPMAAGLILSSVFAGMWVARSGPRVPMTAGCLLAAAGVLTTGAVLGPHVGFSTLGWVLPMAGIGFGIAVVPMTSTPLAVVPPEHSGMAASATNTSRELGAVFGVAILGSIVNAQLTGGLATRLKAIGIPPKFQNLVIHAVTGGGLSSGAATKAERSQNAAVAKIATKVVHAAYSAFGSGLEISLEISGALLCAAALVAFIWVRRVAARPQDDEPVAG
jgi:EmrB/QacA subfamily drug resistance transporter